MDKIARELLAVAQDILAEDAAPVFTVDSAEADMAKMRTHIKAPFVNMYKSTLGGDKHVSIMMAISLDKKEDWSNHIMENSRYFKMSFDNNGTLEMISGGTRKAKGFRKAKAKSIDDAIAKINKFIGELEKIKEAWY